LTALKDRVSAAKTGSFFSLCFFSFLSFFLFSTWFLQFFGRVFLTLIRSVPIASGHFLSSAGHSLLKRKSDAIKANLNLILKDILEVCNLFHLPFASSDPSCFFLFFFSEPLSSVVAQAQTLQDDNERGRLFTH
jgi:hypothetical protein